MQISSIKPIYIIDTQFSNMELTNAILIWPFAINSLAAMIFININYAFLVDF